MLVTITNVSGATLNDFDTITGGVGVSALLAVGGVQKPALPYPFKHIGALTNGSSKTLPMHPSDWTYKPVPWVPHSPFEAWNYMVQAGQVTMSFAAETGRRDQFELFINAV